MATQTTKTAIEEARERMKAGTAKFDEIRAAADLATPRLEETAKQLEGALQSALKAIDIIAADLGWWAAAKRSIRRLFSREFIIAVVSIVVILTGNLEGQEALAVALAGGGLAIGRGVAKARTGGTDV